MVKGNQVSEKSKGITVETCDKGVKGHDRVRGQRLQLAIPDGFSTALQAGLVTS